jgi:crotonobetainyl-CoA:carnitine CoA-transferase CaiB-like acyl-CoA transferase
MLDSILSGVRVIDLTQNVAGPYCTQILGDFGAEVIKVERPGRGDDTRDWRPPEIGQQSSTFLALNRNKQSLCLDLDTAEGIAVLQKLAGSADIFIHSMKPGSPEARGFGYDDLRQVNPALIYCAISAFGHVGPLKGLPGYDPLMQAFTGIMSTTGNDGDDPVRVGVSLIDMGTGMWSALGIFAGIVSRSRTGEGMLVEASLLETGVAWMTVFVANYLATSRIPRKLGSAMAMMAPYELFRSVDGYVFIAAGNDGLFGRVCEGLGCPHLASDSRFVTNPLRVSNREVLHREIEAVTSSRAADDVVATLRRVGAPCSELNNVSQMLSHEQTDAMQIITNLPIEGAPGHKVVALPVNMNRSRGRSPTPPPALGANTDSLLAELGYGAAEIGHLRKAGTIA